MIPLHILALEDNVLVGKDIKENLENQGYPSPRICRSLSESITALDQEHFDLVLIDIIIDGKKDGIELARYLQNIGGIPYIFLTSHDDDINFKEAMQTSPSAYLIKPFKAKELSFQIQLAYSNSPRDEQETMNFNDSFFLPVTGGIKRIRKADIFYIQAKKSSSDIHLRNIQMPERFSVHLGFLNQFLKEPDFIRISRSVLINSYFFSEISDGKVLIKDYDNSKVHSFPCSSDFIKSIPLLRRNK